jgi:hypothetical protein
MHTMQTIIMTTSQCSLCFDQHLEAQLSNLFLVLMDKNCAPMVCWLGLFHSEKKGSQ